MAGEEGKAGLETDRYGFMKLDSTNRKFEPIHHPDSNIKLKYKCLSPTGSLANQICYTKSKSTL